MSLNLEFTEDIAVIKWDDGKANAVNLALISVMNRVLDIAEADAKAVVIAGRSGVFCGGFDLKVLQNGTEDEIEHLIDLGGELAARLFAYPKPVIMACTGHAIAQGAAFLLAGDVRVGTVGEFKIGLNETQIGMTLRHFGPTLAKAPWARYIIRELRLSENSLTRIPLFTSDTWTKHNHPTIHSKWQLIVPEASLNSQLTHLQRIRLLCATPL